MVRLAYIAVCLSLLAPGAAAGSVTLASNPRGDQVLLHRVLAQRTRPLFAGTRAAGGAFAPLAPISPDGALYDPQATVDDSGGVVAAWDTPGATRDSAPEGGVAVKPPGGAFGAPLQLWRDDVGSIAVAGNGGGDAIVTWSTLGTGRQAHYRFKPRGGGLGPAGDLPGNAGLGTVALDDDGTATYLWQQPGTAFGDPVTLRESIRPPGGDFGPARDVATLPASTFDLRVVAAGGRAFVVWAKDGAVRAIERTGDGAFGAPFDLVSREPYVDVRDVKLTASGAAAVAFASPARTAVSVRPPGGAFGKPLSIERGGFADMALNDRGDLAVVSAEDDRTVSGLYVSAATGMPRSYEVASARPFAPGDAIPAVAIDASGQATAAWEESDGATVRTFTRDFDASAAGPRAAVDSVPSFVREAPASACRPPGARVLASSSRATVFRASGGMRGCLLARGVPVAFSDEAEGGTFDTGLSLAGPLAAHVDGYTGHSTSYTSVTVTDLRDPYSGVNRSFAFGGGEGDAWVVQTRLRASGAVAWIDCPAAYIGDDSMRKCARVGGSAKHVYVWNAHASKPVQVDVGRRIDPRTFKLRGSRLTWRNGRKLRHATLR